MVAVANHFLYSALARHPALWLLAHGWPAARLALAAKLERGQRIEALGFSCTEPETIIEALRGVSETPGLMDELEGTKQV